MSISCHEYYAEVGAIAQDAVKRHLEDGADLHDTIFEEIDRHKYNVYYRYHTDILQHSTNDNAYFDNYGPLEADSAQDAIAKMACAAFLEDAQQAAQVAQENAIRTYKVTLTDVTYTSESWQGEVPPTTFTAIVTGESDDADAIYVAIKELQELVGLIVQDYEADTTLTVTFPTE